MSCENCYWILSFLQAKLLQEHPQVVSVELDKLLQKTTTHTPDFLNLPNGAWPVLGGPANAGEGMVIGMLDTGIDPTHESFRDKGLWSKPYGPLSKWKGSCEVDKETFPNGSCNGKVVGAKHFARGIIAAELFNETYDFASPMDGDGHGTSVHISFSQWNLVHQDSKPILGLSFL